LFSCKYAHSLSPLHQIDDISKLAKAALNPDTEHDRSVKELSKTTQMVGEHLSNTCLRGGEIQLDEVRLAASFFEKCIPMLQTQLKLVQLAIGGLPLGEQIKHRSTIETANKCVNLMGLLQNLEARPPSEADDLRDARALVQLLVQISPTSLPPKAADGVASALFEAAGMSDHSIEAMAAGESPEAMRLLADLYRRASRTKKGDLKAFLKSKMELWFSESLQKEARLAYGARIAQDRSRVRYHDMMMGCAIGDAYGAGVEFRDGRWIRENVSGRDWVVLRGDEVLHLHYEGLILTITITITIIGGPSLELQRRA